MSSAEELRKQRQADLDARKKRLEDIRKRRAVGTRAGATGSDDIINLVNNLIDNKKEPEDLAVPTPSSPSPLSSSAPAPFSGPSSSSTTTSSSSSPSPPPDPASPPPILSHPNEGSRLSMAMSRLSFQFAESVDIPPKSAVFYDRETQTEDDLEPASAADDHFFFTPKKKTPVSVSPSANMGGENLSTSMAEAGTSQTEAGTTVTPDSEQLEEKYPPILTEEEAKQVLGSNDFQQFFSRTSVLVERVLCAGSRFNPFVDYNDDDQQVVEEKEKMSLRMMLCDDAKVLHRPVTAIDWSPKFDEWVLCSYADRSDYFMSGTSSIPVSINEPDGVVLVWNMNFPSRPEYHFYCQSSVLSAQFHPTNPKLIMGGTYSGQVVLWDTRQKNTPVSRTPLSQGHTHPVYALSPAPWTQKNPPLITVSTDGKLCAWNDAILVDPTIELDLKAEKEVKEGKETKESKDEKDEVTANCMAFPPRENNTLLLGSDEGRVHKVRLYDNAGVYESVRAHEAPLTSIDFHPLQPDSSAQVADLYLTSSLDWTVKLWSHKIGRPLLKFDHAKDYIYDVKWSPLHPALFANVDGNGFVELWNLNQDTEVPVLRHQVSDRYALNRCRWSRDGHSLAMGDSEGHLYIYDVAAEVCEPSSPDESIKFYEKMHKARADANALVDPRRVKNI